MLKPWANFGLNVLYIFAFEIALFGFLSNIEKFRPSYHHYRVNNGRIISLIKTFFKVYGKFLIAIAITAIIAVVIYKFGTIQGPTGSTPSPDLTPSAPPVAEMTGEVEIKLDEYDVLRKEPEDAFFFQRWDKLTPIKVKKRQYDHSLGVQVPTKVIRQLIDDHKNVRINYEAFIEYSLAYQFDTFQFQYGIDDKTFVDYGLCPTQCHYWIVVESCLSEADTYHKPIELYRTPEVNYMDTLSTSEPIDVSNVETLRITVYWVFDVINSNPLPLEIAIVDPILYKTDN